MALAATFGSDVLQLINKSKVLVVGAGGIGCELLKNLVSSGFKDIETIDLDTIEVSNLNRQFLFRKSHVGKSKAKIAASAVKEFDPSITIKGHLGNIKSSDFDSDYFDKFDIVLNALDNTSARRHVNRLCLASSKSFVESGTRGFIGQAIPVIPKITSCWECTPKESNTKTYPVCTIRSTPDKPVHCIVWSKLIFNLLFGPKDESNMIKDLKVERKDNEDIDEFAKNVFTYLYEKDITEQLSMDDKWKDRQKPVIIKLNKYLNKLTNDVDINCNKMKLLNLESYINIFIFSLKKLLIRKEKEGVMVFEKDDNLIMSFVSSAANLRMHCYHIDMGSEFDNKGIAGNIIHAIATTNAIVAGAMVVQAVHLLKRNNNNDNDNDIKKLKSKIVWVANTGPRWLNPESMEKPNKSCFICQKSVVHLTLNQNLFNFGTFIKNILQKHLGFVQPDVMVQYIDAKQDNKMCSNYLESIAGDEDEDEKKEKELLLIKELNDPMIKIYDKCQLDIEDYSQNIKVSLIVHYADLDDDKHPNGFEVTNKWKLDNFTLKKSNNDNDADDNKDNKDNDNDNDDDQDDDNGNDDDDINNGNINNGNQNNKKNDNHHINGNMGNKENKNNNNNDDNNDKNQQNNQKTTTKTHKFIGKKRKNMDASSANDNQITTEPPTKKLKTAH